MNVDESVAVGVEVAASGATVALIDRLGRVRHRLSAKTLWGRPAPATLEPYIRCIEQMLAYASVEGFPVCGLGLSVPGTIDHSSRRPLLVPTLPALNGFPLSDLLEARFGLPAQLHIDVDAAALGEQGFGAGKGFRRLLYLAVNAVVGAAFVVDGRLERAAPQYVGHVCHIPVATNGPRCSCGKRGCINTLVSLDALQRMVQRALRRGDETSLAQRLSKREYFSPQLLAEEASHGDKVALQVYAEISRWLAVATATYITIFEPEALILGGSIPNELLLQQVRSALMAHPAAQACNLAEIVPAQFGSDAALIGTAAPFLSGDPVQLARQPLLLADVVQAESEDRQSQAEDALGDTYPAQSRVTNRQVRRRKTKSFERHAG